MSESNPPAVPTVHVRTLAVIGAQPAFVARVPAAFFAIVLGISGLGTSWHAAAVLWGVPAGVGDALMTVAAAMWLILALLYAAKWAWAREAALAEWRHPVLCCYVGLVPVATLFAALAVRPYALGLARGLFLVGGVGQVAFSVGRTGGLWAGGRDPLATTPVLYLPAVAGGLFAVANVVVVGIAVGTVALAIGGRLLPPAHLLSGAGARVPTDERHHPEAPT